MQGSQPGGKKNRDRKEKQDAVLSGLEQCRWIDRHTQKAKTVERIRDPTSVPAMGLARAGVRRRHWPAPTVPPAARMGGPTTELIVLPCQ
jgi:hypothetical protein